MLSFGAKIQMFIVWKLPQKHPKNDQKISFEFEFSFFVQN